MLFKALHNHSLINLIITPILLALLWSRFFFIDMVHVTSLNNPAMPAWNFIVNQYLGHSAFTAGLASYLLMLLTGWTVNRIAGKFGLTREQSLMPLLLYGLLSTAFLSVQKLNPVWFFVAFTALAIERIYMGPHRRNHATICFDAALIMSCGTLFYAKGLFLTPILFVAMGILRLSSFRSILATLMGLILPFLSSFTWFFLQDKGIWFLKELNTNLVFNPGQYNHTIYSQGYMSIMILLVVISMIVTFQHIILQKVIIRRYVRVMVWIIFIVTIAVLSPFYSMEMLPVASIATTVTILFWLERIKRERVRESIFALIITLNVAGLFLLN